jgi:flavin-dependent dehydrogenase
MNTYEVIIVGAGPAGCSAAICLATMGIPTLLLEEKRMPREKLCGEFIAPECFPSLNRLCVMDRLLVAGAQKISRITLSALNGKRVDVPVQAISTGSNWGLGLSRSRFDYVLFERAGEAGAHCIERISVKQCHVEDGLTQGVEGMDLETGRRLVFRAPLVIDASGRNSRLSIERAERRSGRAGSRLYAVKAHLERVREVDEQVELYFFREGYGGLSTVEDGLVNLCFITSERSLRSSGRDLMGVVQRTIMNNGGARERLDRAITVGKWHSAGPLNFGRRNLYRKGVITIGDAAGMIDPFTGTGIQMALRTGEMIAEAIASSLNARSDQPFGVSPDWGAYRTGPDLATEVSRLYQLTYDFEFGTRMRLAGALRRLAFSPSAVNLVGHVLASTPGLARYMMAATRIGREVESSSKAARPARGDAKAKRLSAKISRDPVKDWRN